MRETDTRPAARSGRIAAVGFDYTKRTQEPVAACNLCGSGRHVEVSRRDRYGFPARLCVCASCGLGYLSPRLTAPEYARFYVDTYRPLVSAYHGRRIDAETVQEEQRGYAAELVDFLGATLPGPPGSLIDIGGSTGVVAGACAARFGCRATVLDPAPDELRVAAEGGLETVAGFAESFDAAGRRWDLVLMCQTIDHLLDPRATLGAIRDMVAPAGFAFVDVLDVTWVLRSKGAIEEAAKVDHPFYFARPTARALFCRAGFEVVAERLSDDGHWGFVLAPGDATEPDWDELRLFADRLLEEVWTYRSAPA